MSIPGIGGVGSFAPIEFPSVGTPTQTQSPEQSEGFGARLNGALENLQQTTDRSDTLATQMATGELTDVHEYMIAATQTELATQLTVAVRNKAVDAFNQIMNMQV